MSAQPAPRPSAARTSDERRIRPAYLGALGAALGVIVSLVALPGANARSPGPLTPPHVDAKLACASCHGKSEDPAAPASVKAAGKACVNCHGPHPSTRAAHREAAERGQLGCPSCHTIHGAQSGVRLPSDGPAVRYSTWGEQELPELSFKSGETLLVPTIPAAACERCHTREATDPFQRCRSGAGDGASEPTVCFDEHRVALPAAASRPKPGQRPERERRADRDAVCSAQHTEDRPFAWEVARHAILAAPTVADGRETGFALGWLGFGALGGLLGYGGTLASSRVRAMRRTKRAAAPTVAPPIERRLPLIDTSTCLGCYACVDACPYGVLEVQRYVAVVARPDACCGLTLCEQRCPNGSLTMGDGLERPPQIRLTDELGSAEVPGIYLAGDVTGSSLIKSALSQASRAAEAAVRSLPSRAKAPDAVDVCVVGAGPAGIGAALRLSELGAAFVVLEQGEVAQSIQNFPRGKLVFDQPLDLPVAGKLWLEESTKEELLGRWMRIIRKANLPIRQHTRVVSSFRRPDGLFEVTVEGPEGSPQTLIARTLLLCIGQRGTPRMLPAPVHKSMESKLFYHLADARSWAQQRLVVVGLGDVAMETALALSAQPGTSVTILHRGATHSRGQSRNISELERNVRAGRLSLRLNTEVAEVGSGFVLARGPNGEERLPCDAVFVLIGAIPPWDTLERIGLSRPAPRPRSLQTMILRTGVSST